MSESIEWENIEVRLGDLIENPNNPKNPTEESAARLVDSINTLGQYQNIVVNVDGQSTIDGHSRLQTWIDEKGTDFIVTAKKPDRELTEDEIAKIILYQRGTAGEWDVEKLNAHFEKEALTELGGFTDAELTMTEKPDYQYTRKIESPVYTPQQSDPPTIAQMMDRGKTNTLVAEINASDAPEEVKAFMRSAAERHTVFNYKNIAEYYAHAPAAIQRLMEASALVIIDFDQAIEQGFLSLNKHVDEMFIEDHPDFEDVN